MAGGGIPGMPPAADEVFIANAVDYWLARQRSSTSVSVSGERISAPLVKYSTFDEMLSVNPECCSIEGLYGSSEGRVYGSDFLAFYHDLYTMVYVSVPERILSGDGVVLGDVIDFPVYLSSCATPINPKVLGLT